MTLRRRLHLVDDYGMTGYGFVATMVVVLAVIVAVTFCGFTYGGRAVGRTTCRNWGTQTGYETKFVVLNWSDSGTCLARSHGRWVQNTNIIINDPAKP